MKLVLSLLTHLFLYHRNLFISELHVDVRLGGQSLILSFICIFYLVIGIPSKRRISSTVAPDIPVK